MRATINRNLNATTPIKHEQRDESSKPLLNRFETSKKPLIERYMSERQFHDRYAYGRVCKTQYNINIYIYVLGGVGMVWAFGIRFEVRRIVDNDAASPTRCPRFEILRAVEPRESKTSEPTNERAHERVDERSIERPRV
ncbi:hypothetical protein M440DRAFT_1397418 [Trichoderma longibrachiatum ATCC 18648]|uniref:Uncharacterized protein n=1 Tax=Trichoderma longibrachiatum ATCC 18648 TaxID=983965 RepID=A0A2T4CEY6_TRILO|nr:hypothetical protein M440DRAFT_1397418 [Trichoderma longibrachiatum ATCC 18648]